jgi:hypothetical protein
MSWSPPSRSLPRNRNAARTGQGKVRVKLGVESVNETYSRTCALVLKLEDPFCRRGFGACPVGGCPPTAEREPVAARRSKKTAPRATGRRTADPAGMACAAELARLHAHDLPGPMAAWAQRKLGPSPLRVTRTEFCQATERRNRQAPSRAPARFPPDSHHRPSGLPRPKRERRARTAAAVCRCDEDRDSGLTCHGFRPISHASLDERGNENRWQCDAPHAYSR